MSTFPFMLLPAESLDEDKNLSFEINRTLA
jgi:hypothetical protein